MSWGRGMGWLGVGTIFGKIVAWWGDGAITGEWWGGYGWVAGLLVLAALALASFGVLVLASLALASLGVFVFAWLGLAPMAKGGDWRRPGRSRI